jgi:hypothetical protein
MPLLFNLLRIKGLYVSSITCSSSGGAAQMTLGLLRACYVSWLHQFHSNPGAAACAAPPKDEQVTLEILAAFNLNVLYKKSVLL